MNKSYLVLLFYLSFQPAIGWSQQTGEDSKNEKESAEKKVEDERQLYWIFLTTGKSTEGVEKELVNEMQSAHLANFKKLAEKEILLTAGPMADPEKKLRGIVIVRAKDKQDLESLFRDDPYVQKGYLKIEAAKMDFEHGVINTKVTPQGLDEYRLILLEKNGADKSQSEEQSKVNETYISKMSEDKNLLLTVLLPDSNDRQAVLIMAKAEDQSIVETVNEIPSVKSGFWKSRVFPVYMGKGSLSAS